MHGATKKKKQFFFPYPVGMINVGMEY